MSTVRPVLRLLPLLALVVAGAVCGCSSGSGPRGTGAAFPPTVAAPVATSSAAGSPSVTRSARPSTVATAPRGRTSAPAAPYPTPERGKVAASHRNQTSVLDALPGNGATSCASVGHRRDLRSGSIAAGNFAQAQRSYRAQVPRAEVPTVFLYLIPQHISAVHRATVQVTSLDAGTTERVISRSLEEADAWHYFALRIPVRSPGSYRLEMTTGVDHGCFDVAFTT